MAYKNSVEALAKEMGVLEDIKKMGFTSWNQYVKAQKNAREESLKAAEETERLGKVSKKVAEIAKKAGGAAATKAAIDAQNDLIEAKQTETQILIGQHLLSRQHAKAQEFSQASFEERQKIINELIKTPGEFGKEYADILKSHNDLNDDIITSHVSQQMQLEAIAKQAQELNNIRLDKIAKDKGRLRKTGVDLNAIEELEIFLRYEQVRRQLINDEYELKKTQIELEFELMNFRMEVTKAEMEAAVSRNEISDATYNKVIASMNKIPQLQEKVKNSSLSALALRRDADLQSLDVERLKSQVAAERSATEIANSDMTMAEKFSALGKAQADMILAGEAAIRAAAEDKAKTAFAGTMMTPEAREAAITRQGDSAVLAAT